MTVMMVRHRAILAGVGLLALGAVATTLGGCGSGGSGSSSGTGGAQIFTPPFTSRFTVFTDAQNNVSYRNPSGTAVTQQAALQLINSDVLINGGASFTVFDSTTQPFNPTTVNGPGRYFVIVRSVGTPTRPEYAFSFVDTNFPEENLTTLILTATDLNPNLQTSIQAFLANQSNPLAAGHVGGTGFTQSAAVGASTLIAAFANTYL